jgi:ribosomal protein L40E
MMHMCDCEFCESCGVENPTRPALRAAVVEAARELHAARSGQGNFADAKYMDAINQFSLAVVALERAEGKLSPEDAEYCRKVESFMDEKGKDE